MPYKKNPSEWTSNEYQIYSEILEAQNILYSIKQTSTNHLLQKWENLENHAKKVQNRLKPSKQD